MAMVSILSQNVCIHALNQSYHALRSFHNLQIAVVRLAFVGVHDRTWVIVVVNSQVNWHPDGKTKKNKFFDMNQAIIAQTPGVFHVSQSFNNDYDTYDSFVIIAENEDIARTTHPQGGSSIEYKEKREDREISWNRISYRRNVPMPDWYLGCHDSWCHGLWVVVTRICDYIPPKGTEPTYGIVCASFRAG